MTLTDWHSAEDGAFRTCCKVAQVRSLWDRLRILAYLVANGEFVPVIPLSGNKSARYTTTCSQLAGGADVEKSVKEWFIQRLGMYPNEKPQAFSMNVNQAALVRMGGVEKFPSTCYEVFSQVGISQMGLEAILGQVNINIGCTRHTWGASCPDLVERERAVGAGVHRAIILECCAMAGIIPVLLYWVRQQGNDRMDITTNLPENMWTELAWLSYENFIRILLNWVPSVDYWSSTEQEMILMVLDLSLQVHRCQPLKLSDPMVSQLVSDAEDEEPIEAKSIEAKSIEAKPIEANSIEAKSIETDATGCHPIEEESIEAKSIEAKSIEAKPIQAKSIETDWQSSTGCHPIEEESIEEESIEEESIEEESIEAKSIEEESIEAKSIEEESIDTSANEIPAKRATDMEYDDFVRLIQCL
jgi:hypothetical protein